MENTTDTTTPASAWHVARGLISAHIAPDAGLLANAFIHAARQGWLPEGGLPGNVISTALPHAYDRLKARSLFLSMLHTPPTSDQQAWAAVEAISLAPRSWQKFMPTAFYLRQVSERVHRAEAPENVVAALSKLLRS
jgi:hypothetical protein